MSALDYVAELKLTTDTTMCYESNGVKCTTFMEHSEPYGKEGRAAASKPVKAKGTMPPQPHARRVKTAPMLSLPNPSSAFHTWSNQPDEPLPVYQVAREDLWTVSWEVLSMIKTHSEKPIATNKRQKAAKETIGNSDAVSLADCST